MFKNRLREFEIRGTIETIQTTSLLRSARKVSEESLTPEETCSHPDFSKRFLGGAKNSLGATK